MNNKLMQDKLKLYKYATVGILLLFIYVLFDKILPEYVFLFESISNYKTSSQQYEADQHWKEKSISLKKEINRIKTKLEQMNLEMPRQGQISKPLYVLDSLTHKNNINLKELQIVGIDTSKQYQFVTIKLIVNGTFFDIKNLIKETEKAGFVMNVNSLNIKLNSLFRKDIQTELRIEILFKREGNYKKA
jgi:Tfp pilus assembly protein PilO